MLYLGISSFLLKLSNNSFLLYLNRLCKFRAEGGNTPFSFNAVTFY